MSSLRQVKLARLWRNVVLCKEKPLFWTILQARRKRKADSRTSMLLGARRIRGSRLEMLQQEVWRFVHCLVVRIPKVDHQGNRMIPISLCALGSESLLIVKG